MDLLGAMGAHVSRALDTSAARHRAILQNMANVNTPGYKAKSVVFDQRLERAIQVEREGLVTRQDGNNVTMEIEQGEMQKNSLAQQLYVEMLRQESRTMRSAISGRAQ